MSTINGRSSGRNSFMTCVGSGSSEHDLAAVAEIIFRMTSAVYGSNLLKTAGDGGRLDSTGTPSVACRTDATLSLKNRIRSSAVGHLLGFFSVDLPSSFAIELQSLRGCFDCSMSCWFQYAFSFSWYARRLSRSCFTHANLSEGNFVFLNRRSSIFS